MSPFSPPPLDMLKLGWNSVHGYVIYYKKKKNSRPRISFPIFVFFFYSISMNINPKKNDTREKYIL